MLKSVLLSIMQKEQIRTLQQEKKINQIEMDYARKKV